NGSPSLERMDARQAEHPKPSACRNLFGPVDHEELTRDLEKHCRDMEEASQRKWNFDFQNHKPLEDSSTQNKRANRTEENVSDGSPNAGSVEQTPKKPGLRRRQT
ncbi:CDKN1B isoform 3, partial [Pan troglodytes]